MRGPRKGRSISRWRQSGNKDREALKRPLETEWFWTTNSKLFHLFEGHLQTTSCLNQSTFLGFRKTGLMKTLTELWGPLHERTWHSGPEAPAGPGSCLSPADVYALAHEGHTLSPSSSNPCLTTCYLFHPKRHLAGKVCPDDPSITHRPRTRM